MRVACSKGTYIRTLCADIGMKLGCGGTMKSLLRTKVGNFSLDKAITLKQLEELRDADKIQEVLFAVDSAFAECPVLHILPEFKKLIDNGNSFYCKQTEEKKVYPQDAWVRVYADDNFYGIYAYEKEQHRYKPVKMFFS